MKYLRRRGERDDIDRLIDGEIVGTLPIGLQRTVNEGAYGAVGEGHVVDYAGAGLTGRSIFNRPERDPRRAIEVVTELAEARLRRDRQKAQRVVQEEADAQADPLEGIPAYSGLAQQRVAESWSHQIVRERVERQANQPLSVLLRDRARAIERENRLWLRYVEVCENFYEVGMSVEELGEEHNLSKQEVDTRILLVGMKKEIPDLKPVQGRAYLKHYQGAMNSRVRKVQNTQVRELIDRLIDEMSERDGSVKGRWSNGEHTSR